MIKTTTMKISFGIIPKWQQRVIAEAVKQAEDFICSLYDVDCFDLVTLKTSRSCYQAKYYPGYGLIKIDIERNEVYLYNIKIFGSYRTYIPATGYLISYTTQLIHELTHFVQDLGNKKFHEYETTLNEIDYLTSIGYKVWD